MFIRNLFLSAVAIMMVCISCEKTTMESTPASPATPGIPTTPGTSPAAFHVTVSLLAGDSTHWGQKDDADPLKAMFASPKKIIWDDRNTTLYIADGSGAGFLRKLDASGRVSTVLPYVGTSNAIYDVSLAPDKAGALYFGTTLGQIAKVVDGSAMSSLIDWKRQSGKYKEGNEVGSLDEAAVSGPNGIVTSPNGNVYFSNNYYKTIHKINLNAAGNEVTEFAGKPTTGVSAPAFDFADGQGNNAAFGEISDMSIDGNGTVYVADAGYCTVRKITPGGMVSSFLTPTPSTHQYYPNYDGPIKEARSGSVKHVSASQDGTLIFFATPSSLRVIRAGKDVASLAYFNNVINGIAATPDGKTIYVTCGYAIYKVSLS